MDPGLRRGDDLKKQKGPNGPFHSSLQQRLFVDRFHTQADTALLVDFQNLNLDLVAFR